MASNRLARAWRGLCAHYADSGEGSGEYRAVLQAFIDELPETVTNQRLQNGSFWYPRGLGDGAQARRGQLACPHLGSRHQKCGLSASGVAL